MKASLAGYRETSISPDRVIVDARILDGASVNACGNGAFFSLQRIDSGKRKRMLNNKVIESIIGAVLSLVCNFDRNEREEERDLEF